MTDDASTTTTEPQAATEAPAQLTDDHAEALLADAIKTADAQNASADAHKAPEERLAELPGWARNEISQLRASKETRQEAAASASAEARNELAQTIGKALGLIQEDKPVDPAELTAQLTASQGAARQAQVELAVYRNAGDADPSALLDSRAFLDKVKDIDPGDAAAFSAAISEAVQANPRLAAAQSAPRMKPNPAQGASGSEPLSLAERAAQAAKDGDTRQAMLLKAQMAMQTNPGL